MVLLVLLVPGQTARSLTRSLLETLTVMVRMICMSKKRLSWFWSIFLRKHLL